MFTKTVQALRTVWHYSAARRLRAGLRSLSRSDLEAYQRRRLEHFARNVLVKSPYFRHCAQLPFEAWPVMDKKLMIAEFNRMNTAGLDRDRAFAHAFQAEGPNAPPPLPGSFYAGLSSGTSGSRGLFVTSARERAVWAGTVLAKLLPNGLAGNERIALFLRADNRLYQDVNGLRVKLTFFDLFSAFGKQCRRLEGYSPTIIVAPAQVLKALALAREAGELAINPRLVISAAEVLTPQDKSILARVFQKVGEIYQATEGFLGATCEHGTLHLNEEYLYVEAEWLDDTRFIPIITDFTRETQPIVRYRLDDILAAQRSPCPCGSPALAIQHIEGRCDDQLLLPANGQSGQETITIFADVCHRALARALPPECEYQLCQSQGIKKPLLTLRFEAPAAVREACLAHLTALFREQGVALDSLTWQFTGQPEVTSFREKRRRITREASEGRTA
jgi:putative adenylate-forming enzyme